MVDVAISLLSSAATGWKIGKFITELTNNIPSSDRHSDEVEAGFSLLEQAKERHDYNVLKQSIRHFQRVKNDDKKYLQALAGIGQSMAFALESEFGKSYSCLNNVMNMSTTIFTSNKELVEDLKQRAKELKADILELDKETDHSIKGWFRRLFA